MKFGMRKPSIKKSIKARTNGKLKRSVKGTVNPLYGQKGPRTPRRLRTTKFTRKPDLVGEIYLNKKDPLNNSESFLFYI